MEEKNKWSETNILVEYGQLFWRSLAMSVKLDWLKTGSRKQEGTHVNLKHQDSEHERRKARRSFDCGRWGEVVGVTERAKGEKWLNLY